MPSDDGGKADLLDHLALTVPKYATLLDVSAADMAVRQADAAAFRYALHVMSDMQSYAQHWTAQKNLLRDGGTGAAEWPAPPTVDQPIPPAVLPGIVPRASAFVAHLKTHKNYTTAIGQDLWIVGAS